MMSSLQVALLWGATLILPAAILFYWPGGAFLDNLYQGRILLGVQISSGRNRMVDRRCSRLLAYTSLAQVDHRKS